MPEYIYRDDDGHLQTIAHRMFYTTAILCVTCCAVMRRVPQALNLNWNGDRGGRLHPNIRRFIADAPRRRDEYLQKKEAQHARSIG